MSEIITAVEELQKHAGVQAHLALHRYVSSSASPNEINYLKGLGLIPRSGKKNKGKKEKSSKRMHKLSSASPSKAELKKKRQRRRRFNRRLDRGLWGGGAAGVLAPMVYLKATGKVGIPNIARTGMAGMAAGAGLSGLYHVLKEREKGKATLAKTAGRARRVPADRKMPERREYPVTEAVQGLLYGGLLGGMTSHGFEGLRGRALAMRRILPIAALTAAGFAGAKALGDKAEKAKSIKKQVGYGSASTLVGTIAALAPTIIPLALALRAHRANVLMSAGAHIRPGSGRLREGKVLKFPTGRGTIVKNRAKSVLGLTTKKRGEVIPFPSMPKLSAAVNSMLSELEKIAVAGEAGYTLKDVESGATQEMSNVKGQMNVPVRAWVESGVDAQGRPKWKQKTVETAKGGFGSSSGSDKWTATPQTKNVGEDTPPTASA